MVHSSIEFTEVSLDILVEDGSNARLHDERNRNAVRASIARWGQVENLVVQRSTMKVIAGNCRLHEMRELGETTARVALLDIDDKQAAAMAVALNRTSELASWDYAQLTETLRALGDADELIGWDPTEIENMMKADFGADDNADIPSFDEAPAKVDPIKLTEVQRERFARVVSSMREDHETTEGEAVVALCDLWEATR